MTLRRAYKTRNELRQLRIPLVDIILRDGSLYFGIMAFANAINISTFYVSVNSIIPSDYNSQPLQYPFPYMRGALSTFASSMSVTMMSRLMFNLHKVAESGLHTSPITIIQGTVSTFNASPPENPLSGTSGSLNEV
ncbi:hypothetical protein GYMLUDRAFT_247932 [Collybiopsis luxurians FD-317 M1]|uniref:Uncharacterized protein n=1 Tax=Collybiopsis luxurians FD-317 M1 TaxID=944289 RepID=A0A0D0CEI0_9AGAR|nr:hypothetical protein GYMLUDRAFT_247932 [Collybiopsis luxurians FD-317 M1]